MGDAVAHPDDGRKGRVLEIRTNPACLMRYLVIEWTDTHEIEEVEQIMFGALEDE